jgi:uncharacterized protein (TIGR02118 family)
MIKLVYCFRKRAGMTDAEFDSYWRDVHGPLGARIPGLRRLVQSRGANPDSTNATSSMRWRSLRRNRRARNPAAVTRPTVAVSSGHG